MADEEVVVVAVDDKLKELVRKLIDAVPPEMAREALMTAFAMAVGNVVAFHFREELHEQVLEAFAQIARDSIATIALDREADGRNPQ